MAVLSLVSAAPDTRYDFIWTPSGSGYRRYQGPERRSRWHRCGPSLADWPINRSAPSVVGAVLMEVSDDELREIEAGAPHPPRNVGLRAERIRRGSSGGMSFERAESWLSEWRDAVSRNDHLWLGARTSRYGRMRLKSTSSELTAVESELTAVTVTQDAVEGGSGEEITASVKKLYEYPPVVKGWVERPNKELYRCRKIGKQLDVAILREMRENRVHSLAFGQPGCGKTAVFEAAFGDQMLTINGSEDTEAADFEGAYVEGDDGIWRWVFGPLPICLMNGWVLRVEEIGVIRAKQMATLYSVMDGRDEIRITANPKLEPIRAAPGFAVVATANPDSPETRLTDALLSRFGLKISVPSDYKMAVEHFGIPTWLVGAAENMDARRRSKELAWAPQTRDLLLWKENARILGDESAALGVMINSAPAPSRAAVAEVLSKAFGRRVRPLELA